MTYFPVKVQGLCFWLLLFTTLSCGESSFLYLLLQWSTNYINFAGQHCCNVKNPDLVLQKVYLLLKIIEDEPCKKAIWDRVVQVGNEAYGVVEKILFTLINVCLEIGIHLVQFLLAYILAGISFWNQGIERFLGNILGLVLHIFPWWESFVG